MQRWLLIRLIAVCLPLFGGSSCGLAADSRQGGLTSEENLSINPPPPTDVRVAEVKSGVVRLAWAPPAPVTAPHAYSDRVVSYEVFRREAGQLEFRPLARTTERSYTDTAVLSGRNYFYVVSSIREQNAEGTRSHPPVEAAVP
jgi:fibronectin type 3 domain-containing protein